MPKAPDPSRRLSALDALFLHLERSSQPLHVASMLVFDGVIDYARLMDHLRQRLHLVSRYTDRVMPVPLGLAHPTWEPDPEFDLQRHVRHHTLPPPGTDEQLAELCTGLYTPLLSREHPLWELHLIHGYRGGHGASEDFANSWPARSQAASFGVNGSARSALFVKVHHSMIDGVGGVQLLGTLLDTHPKPQPVAVPDPAARPPLPDATTRFMAALSDRAATGVSRARATLGLLSRPSQAVQKVGETADAIVNGLRTVLAGKPRTPFNGRIGAGRELAWITFPLNTIKAIKNRLGGSVNDVVLAVVSGALRKFLIQGGMNPDRLELQAIVPVNVRGAHEDLLLGNKISMMVAPLPVGILDPVERLRQVRAANALLKGRNESIRMGRLIQVASLLPPSAQRLLGWGLRLGAPVNTICTNVPGPPVTLYMQGVRLERMMPFVPLVEGMGVAFAVLSYADTLTIGISADDALVPDPQEVVVQLQASFDELLAATRLTRLREHDPALTYRRRVLRLAS